MSDPSVSRDAPFAHLWPWPGNIFLFLLAVWLLYMGYIASLPDVKVAFFGLGGVTALLLLFGLRTIGRRPVGRRGRRSAAHREAPPEEVRDRRDVIEAFYDEAPLDSPAAIPMNSRMRERARAAGLAGAAAAPEPTEIGAREVIATAADERDEGAFARAEPQATRATTVDMRDDVVNANGGATAMILRERAERGAAIAKVEADLASLVTDVRTELAALREGTDTAAQGLEPDDEGASAAAFLKRDEFNRAVNQKLIPAIEERIGARIADAVKPDVLRAALGEAAGAAGAGTQQDLTEMKEHMSRLAVRVRKTNEKAESIDGLRTELNEMAAKVAWLSEQSKELAARLDAVSSQSVPPPPAAASADVSELRDALSVIIAQNREIREQQQELSGRLGGQDGPDGT